MENFTAAIEKMLNEKLSLYRQMNDLLKEEREFIVNMDVDSLWKTTERKKRITDKIQALRQDILNSLEKRLGIKELDVNSFSISYLVRILPVPDEMKKRLRNIKLAIDELKNELQQAAMDNKKYVQDYLMVIDDIMSVFVDGSKRAQYNQAGTMPTTKTSRGLIHAEV